MHPTISRESLYQAFGLTAFDIGPFYSNEPALRFELSRSGSRVDLFVQAFDRAREIADFAFRDSRSLVAVFEHFGDGPALRHREVYRAMRECGIEIRRPRALWREGFTDWAGTEQRNFLAFAVDREELPVLLWGALGVDIGIQPSLRSRVYIGDPERGLLLHPYDDRGMDAVGRDAERLAELYHRFHAYLLEYDLPRMTSFFGPHPDLSGGSVATSVVSEPMDRPTEVVTAWQDALNREDSDGVLALSDLEIEIVGPRGTAVGADVLRGWLAGTRVRLEPRRTFARGDAVVVEQRGEWRSPEDGTPMGEAEVASVFRVRAGLVVHYARFDTLAEALAHAGLEAADEV